MVVQTHRFPKMHLWIYVNITILRTRKEDILLVCEHCFFLSVSLVFFLPQTHPFIVTHILYWMESQFTDFMQCCIIPNLWEATLLLTAGSWWGQLTAEFWLVRRTEAEDKKRSEHTSFRQFPNICSFVTVCFGLIAHSLMGRECVLGDDVNTLFSFFT